MTNEQIAEAILRASGSALKHYTMQGSRDRIAAAAESIRRAVIQDFLTSTFPELVDDEELSGSDAVDRLTEAFSR